MTQKETERTEIEVPYELPDGWKWCRLGDVCEKIKRGKSPKYTDKSKILVFAQKCNQPDGTMSLEKALFLNEELLSKYKDDDFVKDGDILINSTGTGTIGRVGYFDKALLPEGMKLVPDTHVTTVRACADNASKFFYYFIKQKESYLELKGVGTTNMKELHADVLENLSFPLPPTLTEQQRIVKRIETMFAKLDQAQEKAQAVLDSFEIRKAAILHKAFTGQLKIDNEELTIDNWEETTIGECCKLGSGGTPSKSHPEYYENGDIPWLKTGEIDWNDIYDVEEKITNEGVENSSAKIFPAESVVVAMYGMGVTRGKAAIIKIPTTTNQAVCVLQPNEKLNNRFLFYFFMCNYWQIREQSVGGNQLNLSGKIIASFPIKLPPLNYQLSIVNFLDTVLEKESRAKEAAQIVLDQIALLKKSILARAFRGEL